MSTDQAQHTTLQTGHIGLNVSDLECSRQFYQAAFGFQVVLESQADGPSCGLF